MLFFRRKYSFFVPAGALAVVFAVIVPTISAVGVFEVQMFPRTSITAVPLPTPTDNPVFSAYKGVSVGMTTDAARKLLGKAADQSDVQDSYVFSDKESAQIYYNAARIVTAISITYSGNLNSAPTPNDIFGEPVAPNPDGGIFKMVRYPKAGFWISYNRTSGSDAIVSVAIQKIG